MHFITNKYIIVEKKTWTVYLKEGTVKSFFIYHTVEELSNIKVDKGCLLTTPSGALILVNESNIACIVEQK